MSCLSAHIPPVSRLQKKYRELRVGLGETGAGVTGDEATGADSILGVFVVIAIGNIGRRWKF